MMKKRSEEGHRSQKEALLCFDLASFLFRSIVYYRAVLTQDLSNIQSSNDHMTDFKPLEFTLRTCILEDIHHYFYALETDVEIGGNSPTTRLLKFMGRFEDL
jgi:hypothetical protein